MTTPKEKKLKILGNVGRHREDFRRLSVKPVPTYKESLRAKRQCRQASRRLSSAVGEAGADVQGKSESEAAMLAGMTAFYIAMISLPAEIACKVKPAETAVLGQKWSNIPVVTDPPIGIRLLPAAICMSFSIIWTAHQLTGQRADFQSVAQGRIGVGESL